MTEQSMELIGMSKEQCLIDKIIILDFGYLSF